MPEFESYIDVDVDEMLDACSSREKDELIDLLVEEGLVKRLVGKNGDSKLSIMESEFFEKIDMLKNKYYSLSREDEETMNNLFKKYL
jgi:type III secretory pathway lipoprotein EscJ